MTPEMGFAREVAHRVVFMDEGRIARAPGRRPRVELDGTGLPAPR